jgi:putative spermidine/putrescine transport system substrate-binding protein
VLTRGARWCRNRSWAIGALLVSACATMTPSLRAAPTTDGLYEAFSPAPSLLNAARVEGALTAIALPHEWCNYGEVIGTFAARTGLRVNELDPLAGFGDELDAVRTADDDVEALAPDVIDVAQGFGARAKGEGLLASYKVATWDEIPAESKDADGAWSGGYFGVMAFEVNTGVIKDVPGDWSDLLGAVYRDSVALAGDPGTSGQGLLAVLAASLAASGSLDDPAAGVDFFRQLKLKGNLLERVANSETVASGETPIAIRATFNALRSSREAAAGGGPVIDVVIPATGRLAGVYAEGIGSQAISAHAPHPNAARLWQEFLFSDEGQNLWLDGFCHPIRYARMTADGRIPAERVADLPDIAGARFPSMDQLAAAREVVAVRWSDLGGPQD